MLDRAEITQNIKRIENTVLNIKDELKILKNRVRAYKGWTKRYRQQKSKLKQEISLIRYSNKIVCQQRDEANKQLHQKQAELFDSIRDATQAKELRDKAILELDNVIAKVEEYKRICERVSKTNNQDNICLIEKATQLFFNEETSDYRENLDEKESPQMFTDQASINRSLLN